MKNINPTITLHLSHFNKLFPHTDYKELTEIITKLRKAYMAFNIEEEITNPLDMIHSWQHKGLIGISTLIDLIMLIKNPSMDYIIKE